MLMLELDASEIGLNQSSRMSSFVEIKEYIVFGIL